MKRKNLSAVEMDLENLRAKSGHEVDEKEY